MKEYIGMMVAGTIGVLLTWLGKKFITKTERKKQELEVKEKDIDLDEKLAESNEKRIRIFLETIDRLELAGNKMFNELINLKQKQLDDKNEIFNLRQELLRNNQELAEQKKKAFELIEDLAAQRAANARTKECKGALLDKYACCIALSCENRVFLPQEKRRIYF